MAYLVEELLQGCWRLYQRFEGVSALASSTNT
jgi:hypothetical protein